MDDTPAVAALSDKLSLASVEAPTLLRFITCGSVDDGKSTLIGRLLHDTGNIPDDQLTRLVAQRRAKAFRAECR